MSLQALANHVAARAECAGISVDIRILRYPGIPLRPELHDGAKVPITSEAYVRLPAEGILI